MSLNQARSDSHGQPPRTESARSTCSRLVYRVPYYDTDAMGVVHHSNYVRYLELLRVRFLEEHDQPYESYVSQGLHIVVTHVSVDYRSPCVFNDDICIVGRLAWLKLLSFGFSYSLEVKGVVVIEAKTEHAMVGTDGKLKKIPRAALQRLSRLLHGDESAQTAFSKMR